MLDAATYTNHLLETVEFGRDGIFLSDSELRNYKWLYDTNFDEITNFRKGVVEKPMTITVCANTPAEGIQKRNRIYEIFDRDVLSLSPGTLKVDDYYCRGYFISSEKSNWFYSKRYLVNSVTFITDDSDWHRDTEYRFSESTDQSTRQGAKRFPYQYNYWYSNLNSSGTIYNTALQASDFVMRIYGPATNPLVQIGNNTYQVNVSLAASERLEINSADKTINIVKQNGQKENVFWSASKNSYIFEKIPVGKVQVAWSGNFSFDLILTDKRSEPPWIL